MPEVAAEPEADVVVVVAVAVAAAEPESEPEPDVAAVSAITQYSVRPTTVPERFTSWAVVMAFADELQFMQASLSGPSCFCYCQS